MPLGSHPYLWARLTEDFGSLPDSIRADEGTPLCFFGNPLLLPQGWERDDFDIELVEKPVLRATNAGFLVVTIEHDCQERSDFEHICDWVKPNGPFKAVDTELRKYRDYVGYSVVFSGSRSLHFHFVFSTNHFAGAPHTVSSQRPGAAPDSGEPGVPPDPGFNGATAGERGIQRGRCGTASVRPGVAGRGTAGGHARIPRLFSRAGLDLFCQPSSGTRQQSVSQRRSIVG